MKRMMLLCLSTAALAVSTMGLSRSAPPARARFVQSPLDSTATFELGKKVFGGNCAKCHDLDAVKKLPDGTNLLERLINSEHPEALANTRLKKLGQENRDAAWAYLSVLMKRYKAAKG